MHRAARASLVAALRPLRRLTRASRLGIAARLSIAFGAAAVLAVSVNQIAERGTTLLDAIASAPVVAPVLDERTAELLPAALDRYQRAVLARAHGAGRNPEH